MVGILAFAFFLEAGVLFILLKDSGEEYCLERREQKASHIAVLKRFTTIKEDT